MNEQGLTGERSRSVESVRRLRLMALLRDLVRGEGKMEAAEKLGVNYKTLARAIESGRMSSRMSDALERLLLAGGGSAATRQQERLGALEQRVEGLEGRVETLAEEMRGGIEEVRAAFEGGGKALREQQAQGEGLSGERPTQVEQRQGQRGAVEAPPSVTGLRPVKRVAHRRLDPLVVTEEPEPGDEEVYGEAWPLIDEWRRLRAGHPNRGGSLSWLATEERILGMELAMLEEHGLTLPPETLPLRGFGRNGQLNWRRTALYDTRRARAKRELLRWVRRGLTLGMWWS